MSNLQRFDSVWDALEEDPEKAENMKHRSVLLMAITERIKQEGLNQTAAAMRLCISQSRISALMNGKIDNFRLDTLINLAYRLGLQVNLQIAA
jgi:predicted XRE-type DNA-binding protein